MQCFAKFWAWVWEGASHGSLQLQVSYKGKSATTFQRERLFHRHKKGLPSPSCYVEELAWTEAMHQVWVSLYTDKLDGPPLAMILKADRETIF